jgi:hypothetical protein
VEARQFTISATQRFPSNTQFPSASQPLDASHSFFDVAVHAPARAEHEPVFLQMSEDLQSLFELAWHCPFFWEQSP